MPEHKQGNKTTNITSIRHKDEIERLLAIINTVADGIISIDAQGRIHSFNYAACKMFGYDAEEVIGKNVNMLMPEPYHNQHDQYLHAYLTTGIKNIIGVGREAKALKRDGSTFPVDLSVSETTINGEKAFIGTIRDITDKKRDQELAARLGSIVNDSSDEVYILNYDTLSFIQTNESARKNLGYDQTELNKLNFHDLLPSSSINFFPQLLSQLNQATSNRIGFETELKRKNGSSYSVDAKIYLSSFELEKVYIAIIQDTTERNLAEKALKEKNHQIELRARYDRAARLIMAKSNVTYDANEVLNETLSILADELGYKSSAIYIADEWTGCLHLKASYAPPAGLKDIFKLGEGMIGQAAAEQKPFIIDDDSDDALLSIDTGIVSIKPKAILIYPFAYQDRVIGIITLASMRKPHKNDLTFIESLLSQLAISLNSLKHYNDLKELSDQLKKRGREIAEKNAELEQANRMKSEFLANISHELRTPLNAVIGFSEVLKDGILGELTDKQEEYATDIFKSGQHLLSLINDILDLSKIEAGKMTLDPELVNMKELIRNAVSIVKERAFAKRITLSQSVDDDVSPILADARQIKQIVYNLLSNAVKFTPNEGKVNIHGMLDGKNFIIEVQDSGIGISEEDQQSLFQPFEQVDSSISRKYEGTGLGLVLVKRFAELHNGSISVESTPGEGSKFSVSIPYRSEHEELATNSPQVEETIFNVLNKQKDLLLLSTAKDNSKTIQHNAEAQGYKLKKITSLGSLIKHIKFSLPHLIAIDNKTAPNDCFTLLDKVNTLSTSLPILYTSTTRISKEDENSPLDTNNNELITAIAKYQTSLGNTDQQLKVLIVDDDPHSVEIIATNLEQHHYIAVRTYSGEEAIEAANTNKPDIIILDLFMPNISGFDVIQAIKSNPDTANTGIIILTSASLSAQEKSRLKRDTINIFSKSDLGTSPRRLKKSEHISQPHAKQSSHIAILTEDPNKQFALANYLRKHQFDSRVITAEHLLANNSPSLAGIVLTSYVHDAPQVKFLINKLSQTPTHQLPPLLIYNNLDITFDVTANSLPDSFLDVASMHGIHAKINNPYSVLIIDDDKKSTDVLSSTLSEVGYNTLTASDVSDGITLARKSKPNAIIIDLVMSNLSGFDVIEGLKQNQETSEIPLVVLTGKKLSETEHALLAKHVDIIAHKYETRRRELISNIGRLCNNGNSTL